MLDPHTGKYAMEYNVSLVSPKSESNKYGCDVLNGISVSREYSAVYITGNYWDTISKFTLNYSYKNQSQMYA